MSVLDGIEFKTENTVHIGQVPNSLAASHCISTTPLFSKQAIFVIAELSSDAQHIVNTLPFLESTRRMKLWDGSFAQLPEIQSGKHWFIADLHTVEQTPLPSVKSFRDRTLTLSIGDEMSITTIKVWLINAGYERDKTANESSKWAQRGNIIDIYSNTPARIVFNDDTIESITYFDIGTGKQRQLLESVNIPPQNASGRSDIFDHIPKETLVILYHLNALNIKQPQCILEPVQLNGSPNAGYIEPKAYHLRYNEIQQDLEKYSNRIIFTRSVERAKKTFRDQHPSVHKVITSARGFVHQESSTILLTDRSIGFVDETRNKQQSKVRQAMIQSLSPGDYVVHLFHGIARFGGMKTMWVNGMNRDYFVLQYAGTDKLYVPVEQTDRIDKYVGDEHPTIHSLSTASWHDTVRKVKAQSLELAKELLDIYARRTTTHAPQLIPYGEEQELDAACEFELTKDQHDAINDIAHDLSLETPMDRLLCGDVGFGKTEVAIRSSFRAVLNGYQVTVLAPTTVLAQQHLDTFTERLNQFGVNVHGLSRLRTPKQQQKTLAGIESGTVDIVIGTHRLLSTDVHMKKLALVIIDEEQRFGVKAKETFKKLRANTHILTMTATPIPRTLHLSLAGLRSISTILTPPQQRKSVTTTIVPLNHDMIREAIEKEMERNGQTYYIYNRVRGIELKRQELSRMIPQARIGLSHGQMQPAELASVMHRFDVGEIDVLLSTTIVENGLDIPNANTLIVEHASMFGLAELYQLKGRVGRSERQGHAYFFYKEKTLAENLKKRFIALQEAESLGSGFELAMKDMEIRGVGNILGKEQHGQAIKIGLNLYLRLLNQSIQELENEEQEQPLRDIPIDLPIEARIPEQLLPEQSDRILLYQQLSHIANVEELKKKREEYCIKEKFSSNGVLDQHLSNLFDLLIIKLLTSQSPLLAIDTSYPNSTNNLESPRITLSSERAFGKVPEPWEHIDTQVNTTHKIRASIDELGKTWTTKLQQLIFQHSNKDK